jgi:hypothetical protein
MPEDEDRLSTMGYQTMKPCWCGRTAKWIRGTIPTAFSSVRVLCDVHFQVLLAGTLSDVGKWRRVKDGR